MMRNTLMQRCFGFFQKSRSSVLWFDCIDLFFLFSLFSNRFSSDCRTHPLNKKNGKNEKKSKRTHSGAGESENHLNKSRPELSCAGKRTEICKEPKWREKAVHNQIGIPVVRGSKKLIGGLPPAKQQIGMPSVSWRKKASERNTFFCLIVQLLAGEQDRLV